MRLLLASAEPCAAAGLAAAVENYNDRTGGPATVEMLPPCLLEDLAERMAAAPSAGALVVLVDPGGANPLAALEGLGEIRSRARIVLWVGEVHIELAVQCMKLGVRGILRKSLDMQTQVQCLLDVGAGGLCFEQAFSERYLTEYEDVVLTKREAETLGWLSEGKKNKEIAYLMAITEGTLKTNMSRLFAKIGCADRFEGALLALRNGIRAGGNIRTMVVPRRYGLLHKAG
ncbi:MAG: response regulator transcription factor [Acidobacteriota bacterium]|nr:response regulator transcription factor [Acidobacteriota bacterium]